MINSKNHSGFTLVEVMASLLILGMLMGSVFVSETLVLRTVSHFAQKLHRILSAKKFLYGIRKEREKKEEKSAPKEEFVKEAGFTTHLLFEESKSNISAIKSFKDIVVDKVKIEWQEQTRRRNDELITFRFKPKKAKKKE